MITSGLYNQLPFIYLRTDISEISKIHYTPKYYLFHQNLLLLQYQSYYLRSNCEFHLLFLTSFSLSPSATKYYWSWNYSHQFKGLIHFTTLSQHSLSKRDLNPIMSLDHLSNNSPYSIMIVTKHKSNCAVSLTESLQWLTTVLCYRHNS